MSEKGDETKNSTTVTEKENDEMDNSDSNNSEYHIRILEEVNSLRHSLIRRLQRQINLIDEKYNVMQQLIRVKELSKEHPVVTVFLLATILICFLPLFCFMTSMLGFSFVVICSFVFVGGVIATLCIIVVGAILLFGAFVSFGFTAFIVAGYVVCQNGIEFAQRIKKSLNKSTSNNYKEN